MITIYYLARRLVVTPVIHSFLAVNSFCSRSICSPISNCSVFTQFCNDLSHPPFPFQVPMTLRYLALLSASGWAFGTIQNHMSAIKHFHQLAGFPPGWDSAYSFHLALWGCKHFLGTAPFRKHPITPTLLVHGSPVQFS